MVKLNNELHGISSEIAMCNVYGIPVAYEYRNRGDFRLIHKIEPTIMRFKKNHPDKKIIKHLGASEDKHDFLLEDGRTLSMKSFKNKLTMVAPQVIGQPSSNTFYKYFKGVLGITEDDWNRKTYEEQSREFQEFVFNNFTYVLAEYWKGLGTSDLLYLVTYAGNEDVASEYYLVDMQREPTWEGFEITTTRTIDEWVESNTLKLDSVSVGEFQIHRNRNCFKFRFNIKGLAKIGLIIMNK